MKKLAVLALLPLILLLSGSSDKQESISDEKPYNTVEESEEFRAVWISCYDYDFKNLSIDDAEKTVCEMLENAVKAKINNIFLHVIANCDAIYSSKIFPLSPKANSEYDVLKLFIDEAHKRNINLHAWINPYRVADLENSTAKALPEGSVIAVEDKIFLNPSEPSVQELVLSGALEIIENYDIDGIHFDDYFYPTTDESFDKAQYEKYSKETAYPLNLSEWRSTNISSLLLAVHSITQKNNILFGISPSAHIGDDYIIKNGYVDIDLLLSKKDYIDYITPQIYWGYEYPAEEYKFPNMLEAWMEKNKRENVNLYVGIAAYKAGTEDKGTEWIDNHDVIARQIELLREKGVSGYALFSYSSFFSDNSENMLERINYMNVV